MNPPASVARVLLAVGLLVALAGPLAACHRQKQDKFLPSTPGQQGADKFLFDRGTEELKKKHWINAREYFRRLFDTYPTSGYRQEAKLGIGDSYMGENQPEDYVLAANEFREFLQFFPLNPRADYAQYRLALSQVKQMLGPQRDQTATFAALKELDAFVRGFGGSPLMPEVLKLQRQTMDALSDYRMEVGEQYFRFHAYPGAVLRFQSILQDDPNYTHRDEVYFYLAESFYKMPPRRAEALPLYEQLVSEFSVSRYLEPAKKRIAELKH